MTPARIPSCTALIVTLASLLVWVVPATAQEPKGAIGGRVVSAETNAPLARARVELTLVGKESPDRSVTTDLQGRFEFNRVTAGRYTLRASKGGLVALALGQRSPSEQARVIALEDGQVLRRQDITLPRGAAISGRVLDDLGDPVEYGFVTLMRRQFANGERRLVPVRNPVKVNDAGQYRIAGLAPGTYYVAATLLGPWVSDFVQAGVAFAPSYYPAASNMGQARPVTVTLGQERPSIDVVLVPSRGGRISGVVVNSRGQPVANVNCIATQSARGPSGGVASADRATTNADGTFTIENLSPGEQTLTARYFDPASGEEQVAATTLTLGGGDVDGLVMRTTAGVTLTGRIRFESDREPPVPSSKIAIAVEPEGATSPTSVVSAAWDFDVRGVAAGRRRLRLTSLPEGWTVKQIAYQGRDVTDGGIDVPTADDVAGIDIVVTDRLSGIAGALTDGQGRPTSQCSVLAFAEEREKWSSTRFIAVARPDDAGHFSVKALPPGKYLVLALESLDQSDSNDPEFLESVRGRAKKVTLEEAQTTTVDLKVMREERQ